MSPSGLRLLATDVTQSALYLHATRDGAILRDLDAEGAVPPYGTGGGRVHWDFDGAFAAEDTVVAGTSGSDAGRGAPRHWLVAGGDMTLPGEVTYPFPVTGPVRGTGTWYIAEDVDPPVAPGGRRLTGTWRNRNTERPAGRS